MTPFTHDAQSSLVSRLRNQGEDGPWDADDIPDLIEWKTIVEICHKARLSLLLEVVREHLEATDNWRKAAEHDMEREVAVSRTEANLRMVNEKLGAP